MASHGGGLGRETEQPRELDSVTDNGSFRQPATAVGYGGRPSGGGGVEGGGVAVSVRGCWDAGMEQRRRGGEGRAGAVNRGAQGCGGGVSRRELGTNKEREGKKR